MRLLGHFCLNPEDHALNNKKLNLDFHVPTYVHYWGPMHVSPTILPLVYDIYCEHQMVAKMCHG